MDKQELKSKVLELAKKKGLNIAEDSVSELQDLSFEIIGLIIELTPNKYDDMILQALKGKADEALDNLIDKIDGEEG